VGLDVNATEVCFRRNKPIPATWKTLVEELGGQREHGWHRRRVSSRREHTGRLTVAVYGAGTYERADTARGLVSARLFLWGLDTNALDGRKDNASATDA
jgi:3'-phosphoadenosine 5'-phosphosulfate sulfotransferase